MDAERGPLARVVITSVEWLGRRDTGRAWQLAQELDGSGTYSDTTERDDRTQQYVWCLRHLDDIVLHRADRNRDGDYVDAGDGTWHHLTNAQYSSVCLVDSAAAVTTGAGSDFGLLSTIASDTLANRMIGGSVYQGCDKDPSADPCTILRGSKCLT